MSRRSARRKAAANRTAGNIAAATTAQPVPVSGPIMSVDNVEAQRRVRFNPLRSLTPEFLASQLDAFEYGDLRGAALLWEAMAERDDTLKSVKPKREKDISQLDWEIVAVDDSPEAQAHKAALEFFWNNVTGTNAFDRNESGGISTVMANTMSATSYRYAAHHIVWQPDASRLIDLPDGRKIGALTAKLEFVPLYFFENRTGILRFLPDGMGLTGEDLRPGEWMVTKGDGLMLACSVLFMFKRLSLNDWLNLNERFGIPGVLGKTTAAKGSPAGLAMKEAVESFGSEWSGVMYGDDGSPSNGISLVKAEIGAGSVPMVPLVERCDRKMATLYRGADLSTMSAGSGEGSGASLQGGETDVLRRADAQMITESFNQVDRLVLGYQFGVRHGKAYIKVKIPADEDAALLLNIIRTLVELGAPISLAGTLERFGLSMASDGEAILSKPAPQSSGFSPGLSANARALALNVQQRGALEKYLATSRQLLGSAFAQTLQPLRTALAKVLAAPDSELNARLEAFRAQLPAILSAANADPAAAEALQKILGAALASGLATKRS